MGRNGGNEDETPDEMNERMEREVEEEAGINRDEE